MNVITAMFVFLSVPETSLNPWIMPFRILSRDKTTFLDLSTSSALSVIDDDFSEVRRVANLRMARICYGESPKNQR